MEVTHEFRNLDEGEMGQGWRWDAQLETWIGVRWDLDGAEIQYIVTWMELRRMLDGDEMPITGPVLDGGETRPWWTCDANFGLGWMWDLTWMVVRREFTDLNGGETGHWSRCDAYIETWIWVRRDRDVAELQFGWPGWSGDATWLEVRHGYRYLDGDETWSGWRWHMDIGTWMEVRYNWNGSETQI